MEFLDLLVVALMPVLKTLLITGVGLLLAIDRIGLLGPDARHHLNNIVFFVFTPALMVSNLSETITLESLITLTPKHLHGLVIGCCSAGNLGNLLLIIVPAVCEETNSPFGDSSTCSTYGEAYASLSMAVGAIYIWSYVYIIMRTFANNNIGESSVRTGALVPSQESTSSDGHSDYIELPQTSMGEAKAPALNQIIERMKKYAGQINLKMLFSPSTIGVIVGFIIGIISPIRKLMIGDDAPLRVIISSASLLGEATIPSMTLIVGANLLKGLRRSEVGLLVIVGVIAVRYIVLPLLGIVIVKAAHSWGMVGSSSLYQFILMLQYALPPAMSVLLPNCLRLVRANVLLSCCGHMLWLHSLSHSGQPALCGLSRNFFSASVLRYFVSFLGHTSTTGSYI
ncbi:hypothetical protein CJ030_MR2G007939 [Morella rubra]|uniref:Transporter C5D6.04 n=1 Tax=Morella rubra TaxID=262757 RepID=A0A6A1WGK9_9ROSI|nr:hypothetical protein CJ030_MR2G007939 [Morella rubra]